MGRKFLINRVKNKRLIREFKNFLRIKDKNWFHNKKQKKVSQYIREYW
jgi:hypothetical protein